MRDDLQQAINEVFRSAQQWASREWEDAAQRAAGPIITPGDPGSESRMTKGRIDVLDKKTKRISAGVEGAFKARRQVPDQGDIDRLFRDLDNMLEGDVAHIVSRIGFGLRRDAGLLLPLKNRTLERGAEERRGLMHDFKEMLVRLQNEHPADSPASKTTSVVVRTNYGQIGDYNQQQLHVQIQTFRDLIAGIDKSDASKEAKEDAKGVLRRFFENPTVTAVAGGLAEGVVGLLKPPGT